MSIFSPRPKRRRARLRLALLRLTLACLVLAVGLNAWPALRAWGEFERLPAHDFVSEAGSLAAAGDWAAALDASRAGLALAPLDQHQALREVEAMATARLRAPTYRLAQAGRGALTGRGESIEAIGGAVLADLFVFGDVRDLVIQGGHAVRGEPVDPVLVGLSAAGLVLTAAPAADLGLATLKAARRAGALSVRFARGLRRMAGDALRRGDTAPLRSVAGDAATLSRHASPGSAFRVLRHVDDAEDLRHVARLSPRAGGVYALDKAGREGVVWLRSAPGADAMLLRAAGKGPVGLSKLGTRGARHLIKPHPLLGLVKGVWKGHVPALLEAAMRRWGDMLVMLAGAWVLLELLRTAWAWRSGRTVADITARGTLRIEPVVPPLASPLTPA